MPNKSNSESTATIESESNSANDAAESAAKQGESAKAGSAAQLSAIADTLAESMPEVQEHAIAQAAEQAAALADEFSGLSDTDGHPFDPAIHKVGIDGKPTLSAKGKLVKRPGRKAGQGSAASSIVNTGNGNGVKSAVQTATDQTELARMQARQAGNAAAGVLLQLGVIAGGDEWQPIVNKEIGLDEQKMLQLAFGDYFIAKGIVDIPPGIALTVAIGGYMLPRFMMPKTKTRTQRAVTSVKKWWANRKLKKHGLQAVESDNEKHATVAA